MEDFDKAMDVLYTSLKLPEILKTLERALTDDWKVLKHQFEVNINSLSNLNNENQLLREEIRNLKTENSSIHGRNQELKNECDELSSSKDENTAKFNKSHEQFKSKFEMWQRLTAELEKKLQQKHCLKCQKKISKRSSKRFKNDSMDMSENSIVTDSLTQNSFIGDGVNEEQNLITAIQPTVDTNEEWFIGCRHRSTEKKSIKSMLSNFDNNNDAFDGTLSPHANGTATTEEQAHSPCVVNLNEEENLHDNKTLLLNEIPYVDKTCDLEETHDLDDTRDIDLDETFFPGAEEEVQHIENIGKYNTPLMPMMETCADFDDCSENINSLSQSVISWNGNGSLPIAKKLSFEGSQQMDVDQHDEFIASMTPLRLTDFSDINDPKVLPKPIKYVEVVRKKIDREKLRGFDCENCRHYYENDEMTDAELEERLNECSRHRARCSPPPSTPNHIWSVGIPETQDCIDKGFLLHEGVAVPSHADPKQRRGRKKK